MKVEKRKVTLVVRLTPTERMNLERQAAKASLTISEYVRRNIERPPDVTKREYDELKLELLYEIRKIGVNINQVAKKYNEFRLVDASRDLTDWMDKVYQLTSQIVTSIKKKDSRRGDQGCP